jgi:hypothetical protein
MSSRRRAEDNRAATAHAPTKQRLLVEAYRRIATERKLLLLDCAITRFASFSQDGRTMWELLPEFGWFKDSWPRNDAMIEMTAHAAIETVERLADGEATPQEVADARYFLRNAEWAAESDRFGYNSQRLIGSELRYGVAYWIMNLADMEPELKNILDFYLVASSGRYYAWGHDEPLHTDHRAVALSIIDDIFAHPLRQVRFSPSWQTTTAIGIAQAMYDSRNFSAMPILADALEEAGCDSADVLAHCRGDGPHVRGCWVVDLVLSKS